MKNYTKIITSFFLIISSIILAVFLWDKIYFPFTNSLEIIGEYSKQNYNPINEPARYLIFISLPLLVTLLCCNFFIKNSFGNIKKQITIKLNAKFSGSYRSRTTTSTEEFVEGLKSFNKYDFFMTFTYNSNFNFYY